MQSNLLTLAQKDKQNLDKNISTYRYTYDNEAKTRSPLTDFSLKVLLRVKEQRNILRGISKWKANWIGHILRRNCRIRQVIEGKIKEGTG
jgi:hypothetical protein